MTQNSFDKENKIAGSTLHKGLEILFLIEREENSLTAPEIAKKLGIPISSLYRILSMLRSYGMVERNNREGQYALGKRNLVLARKVNEQSLLLKVAHPVIENLAQMTGETVLLTILSGDTVISIDSVESDSPLRLTSTSGEVMPLHAGASGKCLISFLPAVKMKELISKQTLTRFTPYTITDIINLEKECLKIKKDGFAYSSSELHAGAIGIAAPILGANRKPMASLTLGGPEERIKQKGIQEIIGLVCSAAREISDIMSSQ